MYNYLKNPMKVKHPEDGDNYRVFKVCKFSLNMDVMQSRDGELAWKMPVFA